MTRRTKVLDIVQSVFEYLVSVLFIWGGVSLFGAPPLAGEGVLVLIFGGQIALYVYMVWFVLLGLALIFAKLRRRKHLHKYALMAMYLTTIYTSILASLLLGFDLANIADDIIIGVLTAACWLRWKFKTEYINPTEFTNYTSSFRDDLPPTP